MNQSFNDFFNIHHAEKQWKRIYRLGGIASILALSCIFLDVFVGIHTGGNLTLLPQTAVERFAQFQSNLWLGLYNLDLLNAVVQMILILVYFALCAVHRNSNSAYALLTFIVFLFGSVLMVANNSALPMMELSYKYFGTSNEAQRILYAAAGETLLATGAHGSAGIFLGFFIPNMAGLLMSIIMFKGQIFSKLNAVLGIAGSILMLLYVVLVNFVTEAEKMATAIAMPGGLILMAWMVMFTVKLFKLSVLEN